MDQRKPYWRHDDEDDSAEIEEYQGTYASFSDKVERFLMQLVILGLVALALVQTLHTNSTARRMLNLVEGLEGIPWSQVTGLAGNQAETAAAVTAAGREPLIITVVCTTKRAEPGARLLVNGRPVGNFAGGSVSTAVLPGQTVAIDGTAVAEPLTFRVVGPPDLLTPALGSSVTTNGNVQSLGIVYPGK